MFSLRAAVAWMSDTTGLYHPAQWILGRLSGGFILAYHDVPSEVFEQQILALAPNEPVHLSELLERARTGRNSAGLFAVTFDDGVASTVRSIDAVCRRRSWPVTFYLPTLYLDERRGLPFQKWDRVLPHLPRVVIRLPSRTIDLRTDDAFGRFVSGVNCALYTQPRDSYAPLIEELVHWVLEQRLATNEQLLPPEPILWSEVATLSRQETIRFESHGVTHTAVVALSPRALEAELRTSQQRISEHTNRDCRHFCYPFGARESIGSLAPALVAQVFDTATTMLRGRLRGHARSHLPRIPMYDGDGPAAARLKILTV